MSLMRKVLLAGSTSPWLREQATRRAFVRRSVSRFMPGEKIEDAIAAAAALKPQGITTILTRLGEGVTKLGESKSIRGGAVEHKVNFALSFEKLAYFLANPRCPLIVAV